MVTSTTLGYLAVAGATAAAGAAAASMAAQKANKNARLSARSAALQADSNKALTELEFQAKRTQLAAKFGQYNKTLVASSGERGVGNTASTLALQRASLASALRDDTMLKVGETSAVSAIGAQETSIYNQAMSQMQNPFMQGVMGGLQGFQSGASMATSMQDAGWIK